MRRFDCDHAYGYIGGAYVLYEDANTRIAELEHKYNLAVASNSHKAQLLNEANARANAALYDGANARAMLATERAEAARLRADHQRVCDELHGADERANETEKSLVWADTTLKAALLSSASHRAEAARLRAENESYARGHHQKARIESEARLAAATRLFERCTMVPYSLLDDIKAWLAARPAPAQVCNADRDGECTWYLCPQKRDNEPARSGRSCPLIGQDDDE